MKVNAKNMIHSLDNILENIEEYNETLEKTNYEYETMLLSWENQVADKLYQSYKHNYQNLKKLTFQATTLFKYLKTEMNKYLEIGNKIECQQDKMESIYYGIDNLLIKLTAINTKFNNLGNITFYPKYIEINSIKDKLNKEKERLEKEKNNIKTKEEKVNTIEEEILKEISTTAICKIDLETTLSAYKEKERDNYIFSTERVELSSKKINSYIKAQFLIVEKMITNLDNLLNDYESNNTKQINQTINNLKTSLKNALQNFNLYQREIDTNIEKARLLKDLNLNNIEGV